MATRSQIRLTNLAQQTVILFAAGWGIRHHTDRAFTDANIAPDTPYEVADYDTAAGLIRNHLGVTLIPATLAARYTDLSAIPIAPLITWTLALAAAADRPLGRVMLHTDRGARWPRCAGSARR